MLIGLIGKAGAGKDTLASLLKPYGFQRLSFADTLYAEVSELTGVPEALLRVCKDGGCAEWERARTRIRPGHPVFPQGLPEIPRPALQSYGDYRRGQDTDYFVLPVVAQFPKYPRVVVTDVRAENEAGRIRSHGGKLVRILRDESRLLLSGGAYAGHRSETALDGFSEDFVLRNREGSAEAMRDDLLDFLGIHPVPG
jgi:hypothetical protein